MRQIGKKGKEGLKARKILIKEALADGRIEIIDGVLQGICEDCGRWKPLTPDHRIKRSQGGSHDKSNIDWVCDSPPDFCHTKRDQMGDPRKKKPKSKKANWQKPHRCRACKKMIGGFLLCPNCNKISI